MVNWFFKNHMLFNMLLVVAFWVLVLSIFDVVFGKGWMVVLLVLYIVVIVLFIIGVLFRFEKKSIVSTVEEFEKTLKGGLFHFKCPVCGGVFAVKKSKSNNKKPVRLTCPDCGVVGVIPSKPRVVEETVPEKKSMKASFKCTECGEGVSIWAEGADLYQGVCVFSCPFCGSEKPLKRF